MTSISAFANDPLSVSISGPHKIFTNDNVIYTATVIGANPNACVWSVEGETTHSYGQFLSFVAPSIDASVTIFCTVTIGEGEHQKIAEDTITVYVVTPQINIDASSLDLDNPYSCNGPNIVHLTNNGSVAFIHKNGMELLDEALELGICITPNDVDIQNFELTTSDISSLYLYKNESKLPLPHSPSNVSNVSALNNELNGLRVWGKECGTGYSVTLKINNSQKINLSYKVYGIGHSDFTFATKKKNLQYSLAFPDLVKNEWGYEEGTNDPKYNCLAYAIKNPSLVNGHFFWCNDILPPSTNFVYANRFLNRQGYNSYITCVDIFGNSNNTLENSDVDAYFMDALWGQDKANSFVSGSFPNEIIPNGDIVYYSGIHAARKSNRNTGAYTNWQLLESKCGGEHILIHRPKHICGLIYGTICRIYFR